MLFLYLFIFIQVLLEIFPASSSGHCLLLEQWYSFLYHYQDLHTLLPGGKELFSAFLHGPTLILLALFFLKQWSVLLLHMLRCRFIIAKIIFYVMISTIIALFFYFVVHIQDYPLPLGIGFLITAIAAFSLRWCKEGTQSFTFFSALVLGVVQSIALLPGISRLGMTYAVARWLGISSRRAFEISFLIQTPLIGAAFGRSTYIFIKYNLLTQVLNLPILLVMLSATGAAWYGLKITAYSATHRLWWYFAVYMSIPLSAWLIVMYLK